MVGREIVPNSKYKLPQLTLIQDPWGPKQKRARIQKSKIQKMRQTRIGKKTSEVWNYFKDLGDEVDPRSKCRICDEVFKCPGGSTTGMRGHLERKHPGTLSKMSRKMTGIPKIKPLNPRPVPGATSAKSNGGGPPKMKKIVNGSVKRNPSNQINPRKSHEDTTRALAHYCIVDLKPLSSLENPGFKGLLNHFDPSYLLQTQDPTSNNVRGCIQQMYSNQVSHFRREFAHKFLSITIELWNKNNSEKFMSVSAHFVSEDWKLESRLLGVRPLPLNAHLSENPPLQGQGQGEGQDPTAPTRRALKLILDQLLHTFHIKKSQIVGMVYYSHPHKLPFSMAREFSMYPCINQFVLKIFDLLRTSLKDLLNYDYVDLCEKWAQEFLPNQILSTKNPYLLVQTILKVKSEDGVEKGSSELNMDELRAIEGLLSPLNSLIEVLQDETCTLSISSTLPIMYAFFDDFKTSLEEFTNLLGKGGDVKEVIISKVRDELEDNYRIGLNGEENGSIGILSIASYLDPRYKNMKFFTPQQKQGAYEAMINLICALNGIPPPILPKKEPESSTCEEYKSEGESNCSQTSNIVSESSEGKAQEPTSSPREKTKANGRPIRATAVRSTRLSSYLKKVVGKSNDELPSDKITFEITQYLNYPVHSITDPLDWWKNTSKFPNLSALAKKFFSVPALSTNTEDIFRGRRKGFEESRASLETDMMDQILFLNNAFPRVATTHEEAPLKIEDNLLKIEESILETSLGTLASASEQIEPDTWTNSTISSTIPISEPPVEIPGIKIKEEQMEEQMEFQNEGEDYILP